MEAVEARLSKDHARMRAYHLLRRIVAQKDATRPLHVLMADAKRERAQGPGGVQPLGVRDGPEPMEPEPAARALHKSATCEAVAAKEGIVGLPDASEVLAKEPEGLPTVDEIAAATAVTATEEAEKKLLSGGKGDGAVSASKDKPSDSEAGKRAVDAAVAGRQAQKARDSSIEAAYSREGLTEELAMRTEVRAGEALEQERASGLELVPKGDKAQQTLSHLDARRAPSVQEVDAALELCLNEPSELDVARRVALEDPSQVDLQAGPGSSPGEAAARLDMLGEGMSEEAKQSIKEAAGRREAVLGKSLSGSKNVVLLLEERLRARATELRALSSNGLSMLDCFRVAAAEEEARSAEHAGRGHWLQRAVKRDEETREGVRVLLGAAPPGTRLPKTVLRRAQTWLVQSQLGLSAAEEEGSAVPTRAHEMRESLEHVLAGSGVKPEHPEADEAQAAVLAAARAKQAYREGKIVAASAAVVRGLHSSHDDAKSALEAVGRARAEAGAAIEKKGKAPAAVLEERAQSEAALARVMAARALEVEDASSTLLMDGLSGEVERKLFSEHGQTAMELAASISPQAFEQAAARFSGDSEGWDGVAHRDRSDPRLFRSKNHKEDPLVATLRRRHAGAVAKARKGREARAMELGLTEVPDSELMHQAALVRQGRAQQVLDSEAGGGEEGLVVGESMAEKLRTRVRLEDAEEFRMGAAKRAEEARKTGGRQMGPGAFTLSPAGRMAELHAGMPSTPRFKHEPYDPDQMALPVVEQEAGDMTHPAGRLNSSWRRGELMDALTRSQMLDGYRGPQVENVTDRFHAPYGTVSTWGIEDPELAASAGETLMVMEGAVQDAVSEAARLEYEATTAEGATVEDAHESAVALAGQYEPHKDSGEHDGTSRFVAKSRPPTKKGMGSFAYTREFVAKAPKDMPAAAQLSTAMDTDPELHVHDEARRSRARAYADALDALHNRRAPLLLDAGWYSTSQSGAKKPLVRGPSATLFGLESTKASARPDEGGWLGMHPSEPLPAGAHGYRGFDASIGTSTMGVHPVAGAALLGVQRVTGHLFTPSRSDANLERAAMGFAPAPADIGARAPRAGDAGADAPAADPGGSAEARNPVRWALRGPGAETFEGHVKATDELLEMGAEGLQDGHLAALVHDPEVLLKALKMPEHPALLQVARGVTQSFADVDKWRVSVPQARSVKEIYRRLRSEDTPWARSVLRTLKGNPQVPVKVTHRLVAEGSARTLSEAMQAEFRANARLMGRDDFMQKGGPTAAAHQLGTGGSLWRKDAEERVPADASERGVEAYREAAAAKARAWLPGASAQEVDSLLRPLAPDHELVLRRREHIPQLRAERAVERKFRQESWQRLQRGEGEGDLGDLVRARYHWVLDPTRQMREWHAISGLAEQTGDSGIREEMLGGAGGAEDYADRIRRGQPPPEVDTSVVEEAEAKDEVEAQVREQWQQVVAARQLALARRLRGAAAGDVQLTEQDLEEAEWLDRVDENLPSDPALLDEDMLTRMGLGTDGVARTTDDTPTLGGPLRLQAVAAVGKRPSQLLREAERRATEVSSRLGPGQGKMLGAMDGLLSGSTGEQDMSLHGPLVPALSTQARHSAREAAQLGRAPRTFERDQEVLQRVGARPFVADVREQLEGIKHMRAQGGQLEDLDAPLSADEVATMLEEGPDQGAGLRAPDRDVEEAMAESGGAGYTGAARALSTEERAESLRRSAARALAPGLLSAKEREEQQARRETALQQGGVDQLERAWVGADEAIHGRAAHTPLEPGQVLDGAPTTAAGWGRASKLAAEMAAGGDQEAALRVLLEDERESADRELSVGEDVQRAGDLPGLTGLRARRAGLRAELESRGGGEQGQ